MKRLKSIFNTLYFSYLLISILLFTFKDRLLGQMDQEFLFRFLNFWVILGFVFFISVWVIQAIHIGFLKKDIIDLEDKILELKSKLYDFSGSSEVRSRKNPRVTDAPHRENPNPEVPPKSKE